MVRNLNPILFISFLIVHAETHIAGDISGIVFELDRNPYIVEQDIIIPAGNKAVIKEGCVFLFKPFTGLTVHGLFAVEGTQEQPVIFTSINDGEYNTISEQLPNPFDWNGILVTREAGAVTLKNFSLRFSVYGIKSQNTNIVLENGLFSQNGQFHFTTNNKIQFVQDNIKFNFKSQSNYQNDTVINNDTKLPIIIGVAGGVGAIVSVPLWLIGDKKYQQTKNVGEQRDLKGYGKIYSVCGSLSLAAIVTAVVLNFRKNLFNQKRNIVTIAPFFTSSSFGAQVVFNTPKGKYMFKSTDTMRLYNIN